MINYSFILGFKINNYNDKNTNELIQFFLSMPEKTERNHVDEFD